MLWVVEGTGGVEVDVQSGFESGCGLWDMYLFV